MDTFLLGAIAMASMILALLFLRFHRRTRDRFFLFFAISFFLEGLGRVAMATWSVSDDDNAAIYVLRLVAYGLILAAVLDKNLPRRHS